MLLIFPNTLLHASFTFYDGSIKIQRTSSVHVGNFVNPSFIGLKPANILGMKLYQDLDYGMVVPSDRGYRYSELFKCRG